MRLRILTFVAILALVRCSGGTSDGDVVGVEVADVYGTVTYVDSGLPVRGATVSIGVEFTNSNPDGSYRLANIEVGEKSIRVTRTGYVRYEQTFDVTAPGTSLDVPLAADAAGGALSGLVFDPDTGQPVAGAEVTVAGVAVLADASGIYRFPAVPQGTHEIIGTHADYLGAIGAVYVSAADRTFSLGMIFAHCFEGDWFEGSWQDYALPELNNSCHSLLVDSFKCDCSNDPCVHPRDQIQCLLVVNGDHRYCVDYDPETRKMFRNWQHCNLEIEFSRGAPAVIRWQNTAGTDAGQYPGEPRTSSIPAELNAACN